MRKFLTWLTGTRFWSWLLLKELPFIRFSMYYTKINGFQFWEAWRLLQPGDIILCVDNNKGTTKIEREISEFLHKNFQFSHAVFYLGISKEPGCGIYNRPETAEMDHMGMVFRHFFDACKESDRVVAIRCNDYDELYINKMIEWVYKNKDASYDVTFTLGVKELYCSELIYQADMAAGNGKPRMDFDLSDVHGLGCEYISPDGLLAAKNITVIYDSDQSNYKGAGDVH